MFQHDFAGRGRVAVVDTRPGTVLTDIQLVMEQAGVRAALASNTGTLLSLGRAAVEGRVIAGTTPWQLEGTIQKLEAIGCRDLVVVQQRAAGHDPAPGDAATKINYLTEKYGLPTVSLDEPQVEWVRFVPTKPFLALDQLVPEGVRIPRLFIDRNVVHLPAVLSGSTTAIAGALNSAFGRLRHGWKRDAGAVMNEVLVDLLQIQIDVQRGQFAVMDGTATVRQTGQPGIVLASADLVALDAVRAMLLGLDPMAVPFIRMAHEKGLGVGDARAIKLLGAELSLAEWASCKRDMFPRGHDRMSGRRSMVRSLTAPIGTLGSRIWSIVEQQVGTAGAPPESLLETDWGRLFVGYGDGVLPPATARPGARLVVAGVSGVAVGAAVARRTMQQRKNEQ